MMLMNPQKKIASIIVSKMSGNGESKDATKPLDDTVKESDLGLESAMDDFMKAFEAKDSKAAAAALKDFIYLCGEAEEEGPEEPEVKE